MSTTSSFEIRRCWLHAKGARYNLSNVTCYINGGDHVMLAITAMEYLQRVYVTDAPGESFGAGARRLLEALDAYFENVKDEPRP